MYKILLVDDEKLELEAIAQYIRWEDMGIVVAGTAKNGREALARMEACKPDIVMTDVRMPIMDGLEFARKARQLNRGVKIVFLSGHDEFHYIKAALNAEAMGYLLKPIDADELAQLMQRVVLKCEEDKQLSASAEGLKEKLVRSLAAEKSAAERKSWAQRISMLPVPLPAVGAYAVAYVRLDGPPGADAAAAWNAIVSRLSAASYGWSADEREYGAICYLPTEDGFAEMELGWRETIADTRSLTGIAVTVGLSTTGRYLEEMPELYEEAKRASEDRFYAGTGTLLRYRANAVDDAADPMLQASTGAMSEVGEDPMPGMAAEAEPRAAADPIPHAAAVADRLTQAVSRLRREEAGELLRGCFAPFRTNRTERSAVVAFAMQLGAELERSFAPLLAEASANGRGAGLDWKEVMAADTLDALLAQLEGLCDRLIGMIGDKDQDQHMPIVHRIMELIDSRYHEALTVEALAESVYLTPNYVRTLFKQKTGETILEYMTRVRIRRASELLRDRALRIHEVARAVGYENVSYFCSLFQRHKGVTPNEYRKKRL
ncbi:response regulator [Cohnella nanjingensis]|uniref:Response regulator n=1 Tax=Cohnella nanjingensis TaxID=1387779 RepID=A0A7X0RS93_9BACL|nr:response regulator [Cohnella nanjingensis]MBB6671314.1 response regulator [Cohnella nanjingensis]